MESWQEKIIRRKDGSRVKIITKIHGYSNQSKVDYSSEVETCGKGKRKWLPPYDYYSSEYRILSVEDRRQFVRKSYLAYVSENELWTAKNELWESLRP